MSLRRIFFFFFMVWFLLGFKTYFIENPNNQILFAYGLTVYGLIDYVGQGLTVEKNTITNVNIANTTVLLTVLSSYDVICII